MNPLLHSLLCPAALNIDKRSTACRELGSFMMAMSVIFLVFALFGVTVFGPSTRDFHNLPSSLMTLVHFALGDFEKVSYDQMKYSHHIGAPIFLLVFIVLIVFVALNCFIAIIMASYERAVEEKNWWKAKRRAVLGQKRSNTIRSRLSKSFLQFHSFGHHILPQWEVRQFLDADSKGVGHSHESLHRVVVNERSENGKGSILRVHYSRNFYTENDKLISDVEHRPELTHRDKIAHDVNSIKLQEMQSRYADDVILLKALQDRNKFVSQNASTQNGLLDNLQHGELLDLVDRWAARFVLMHVGMHMLSCLTCVCALRMYFTFRSSRILGNYLTVCFVGREELTTRVDIRTGHEGGVSTFKVVDCFLDLEVITIVGDVQNYTDSAMSSRHTNAGSNRPGLDENLRPAGLMTTQLSFAEHLKIPTSLCIKLWFRAACMSVGGSCRRQRSASGTRNSFCCNQSCSGLRTFCTCFRLLRQNERDKEQLALQTAVETYLREQCYTISKHAENDEIAAMYDAFAFHPDNPLKIQAIAASVRLWIDRRYMVHSQQRCSACTSALMQLLRNPHLAKRRLHSLCKREHGLVGVQGQGHIELDHGTVHSSRVKASDIIRSVVVATCMRPRKTARATAGSQKCVTASAGP